MNKYLERINNSTLEILSECPSYKNLIYLLEDYSFDKGRILVMYDTFHHERKALYISKDGVYINGRANSDDPTKVYLKDFKGFSMSDEDYTKVKEKMSEKANKLDSRIPSRDIKIGYLCREFKKAKTIKNHSYYIYLGKAILNGDRKENIYISVHKSDIDIVKEEIYNFRHIDSKKSKKRFDRIEHKLTKQKIIVYREMVETTTKYPFKNYTIEWVDSIE